MAKKYVLGPAGARKLRALFNGRGESGSVRGSAVPLVLEDEFALPFAVQWAQSADGGSGSWIIWLPGSALVVTPDGDVNPAASLTAVGGDYPAGWYILTDAMLDRDDGGTLYLNVTLGSSPTAAFASSASSASNTFAISICTASVDSSTEERSVRQFVSSALVVGGGEGGGSYGCDEASISRIAHTSQSGEAEENGNNFYIKGFGKWTIDIGGTEVGSYHAPSTSDIDLDDDEPTEFAVICRDGNVSAANGNTLSYRKLKIKSNAGSSPFAYKKSTTVDSETHETVTLHKLVNCCFYWNGALQSLADYDVSALMGGGTVYLRGTQAAPSSSSPDPTWSWDIGTSVSQAPNGGKALNYKLYDFAQSKVAVDYRTTFLALEDHTQKAKITVGKPTGSNVIELDASGNKPKIVITDGTKSITLDLAALASGCNGLSIHSLTYKDSSDTSQTVHGLMCADVDLSHLSGGGGSLPDVDLVKEESFSIKAVDGYDCIVAALTKYNLKTGNETTVDKTVCRVSDLDVVVGSEYSSSSHVFKNSIKGVKVIGEPTAKNDATVFTATSHSAEHGES